VTNKFVNVFLNNREELSRYIGCVFSNDGQAKTYIITNDVCNFKLYNSRYALISHIDIPATQ
jgi:hypothetical protein